MRGSAAGDLYIFITVAPHPIFQRDGADIDCRVPIPITTAALGGAIEVPTVDGSRTKVTYRPAPNRGTNSGCAARGCQCCARRCAATCFVEAVVETPVNLTNASRNYCENSKKKAKAVTPIPRAKASSPASKRFFEDLRE